MSQDCQIYHEFQPNFYKMQLVLHRFRYHRSSCVHLQFLSVCTHDAVTVAYQWYSNAGARVVERKNYITGVCVIVKTSVTARGLIVAQQ